MQKDLIVRYKKLPQVFFVMLFLGLVLISFDQVIIYWLEKKAGRAYEFGFGTHFVFWFGVFCSFFSFIRLLDFRPVFKITSEGLFYCLRALVKTTPFKARL